MGSCAHSDSSLHTMLAVEPIGRTRQTARAKPELTESAEYLGRPHHHTDQATAILYGGLLLGQATHAAQLHALERFGASFTLHSLRAYFLRRATSTHELNYRVNTLRKGRTFAIASVCNTQASKHILDLSASFHTGEVGFAHQVQMPEIELPSDRSAITPLEVDLRDIKVGGEGRPLRVTMPLPVWMDLRHSRIRLANGQVQMDCWLKTMSEVPDQFIHQVNVLSYLSDYCTMASVVYNHDSKREIPLFIVSLDHALWIYDTPKPDEWHLYSVTSPIARDGRGLSSGRIFGADGRLWACFNQEGLVRRLSEVPPAE